MNRRIVALAIAVPLLLGGGLWWYLHRSAADDAGESKPTAQVAMAPLKKGAISRTVEAYGVVEAAPGTDQTISAPFDCFVTAVMTEPAAEVAAGDVLLQITPSPESKLLIDAAQSALVVAEKDLSATQERFDLKLATQQELVVARQAEVDAKAKVMSYRSRGVAEDGKIRAATAGVISKLEVTSGTFVQMGAPLASVATVQGREARLELDGSNRALLARNQTVMLTSSDSSEATPVTARVRAVGAALNAASGSLELRVPVPAGSSLMQGEHVRALIEVAKHDAVLIVPRSAVLPDDDAQVLYTVKNNKAVRHEVTLGISDGELQEVSGAGLSEGDVVVVTGNYELADGMAVQEASQDKAAEARTKDADAKDADAKGGAAEDSSKADPDKTP